MGKKKKTRKEKYATVYPIVSHWSQFMRWFLLVAIIGFIFLAYQFYSQNPTHPYWQIGDVILWVVLSILLVGSILALFGLKKYTITEETITISNYWHKVIRIIDRKDLLAYYEDINKNKNDVVTSRTLRIKTKDVSIKINSTYYNNYKELKNELRKGLVKDKKGEMQSAKRWTLGFGIGMILFSTLLFYVSNPFSSTAVASEDYTFMNGTVKNIIFKTHRSRKSRTSYSVNLRIKDASDFVFKLSDNIWSKDALQITSRFLKKGDPISIAIKKDDYLKKILKTSPLSFWDKHSNYGFISFVAVSRENRVILDLNTYISLKNQPPGFWSYLGIGFLILVFLFGCFLIYLVFEKDKRKNLSAN